MRILGLQKVTLLDYPGLVAATVFTGGCNFRCPFCHNAALVVPGQAPEEIPEAEVMALLRKRKGVLDGLCVTGGEPLMQPDIIRFLAEVKSLGYRIKLDTNGSFPEKLRQALDIVDTVAMDIKNSPEKYAATAGVRNFDLGPVRESAALLMEGRVDFEFRTTVVKGLHEPDDFRSIGRWLRGDEKYFLQQFKDSGGLIDGRDLESYSESGMRLLADIAKQYIPNTELRGI